MPVFVIVLRLLCDHEVLSIEAALEPCKTSKSNSHRNSFHNNWQHLKSFKLYKILVYLSSLQVIQLSQITYKFPTN